MELTAPPQARDRVIVALDFPSAAAALDLVDRLDHRCLWFKVGLELFLAAGPSIVGALRSRGFRVFVDLKLHDIPNTAAGAVRSLASCGASMLTVHAAGGEPMMAAAAQAAATIPDAPTLLAVTVLTSMDAPQLAATGVADSPGTQVHRLAKLAHSAGIPNLVCSSLEVASLRRDLGPSGLLVVPGIRPVGSLKDDQNRTATPGTAIADGASYLVVGRPITQALNPQGALESILAEVDLSLFATAELHHPGR